MFAGDCVRWVVCIGGETCLQRAGINEFKSKPTAGENSGGLFSKNWGIAAASTVGERKRTAVAVAARSGWWPLGGAGPSRNSQ